MVVLGSVSGSGLPCPKPGLRPPTPVSLATSLHAIDALALQALKEAGVDEVVLAINYRPQVGSGLRMWRVIEGTRCARVPRRGLGPLHAMQHGLSVCAGAGITR